MGSTDGNCDLNFQKDSAVASFASWRQRCSPLLSLPEHPPPGETTASLTHKAAFSPGLYWGTTDKNCRYLRCTIRWFDIRVRCERIITVKLINIICTLRTVTFFFF